jgi:hypothetical protein
MELQGELRLRNNSITCESGEKTFCTLGTRQNMVARPFRKTFFAFWTHSGLILDSFWTQGILKEKEEELLFVILKRCIHFDLGKHIMHS